MLMTLQTPSFEKMVSTLTAIFRSISAEIFERESPSILEMLKMLILESANEVWSSKTRQ